MENILEKILNDNTYYNITIMPFDYISFIKHKEIIDLVHAIKDTEVEKEKEELKYKLLTNIYTNLYKLNLSKEDIKNYFEQAILTDKFKTYLGVAFKFSIQYNNNEDTIVSTFIHLAQFFMSDICYEYLWKLEHQKQPSKFNPLSKLK